MKKIFGLNYFRIAKLFFCLFILYSSSCRSLSIKDRTVSEIPYSTLKVRVCERDFILFMKTMKELNITAIDVKPIVDDPHVSCSVLFKFLTKNDFLRGRSEILSTGLVKRIN